MPSQVLQPAFGLAETPTRTDRCAENATAGAVYRVWPCLPLQHIATNCDVLQTDRCTAVSDLERPREDAVDQAAAGNANPAADSKAHNGSNAVQPRCSHLNGWNDCTSQAFTVNTLSQAITRHCKPSPATARGAGDKGSDQNRTACNVAETQQGQAAVGQCMMQG